mgnify:CR=1 FL=1
MNYLLYDNACPFCCNIVKKISPLLEKRNISYIHIKSKKGISLINKYSLENINSIIYINQNNKVFIKSTAILNICKLMKFPYNLTYILIVFPKFFLNIVYDFIAKNRMYITKN